jgi:protocatechuate 3,4-dioxygenase beta subunit
MIAYDLVGPHDERTQPLYAHDPYGSTRLRAPRRGLVPIAPTLTETQGPSFASGWAGPAAADLTVGFAGEPQGQRIIVTGRVLDEDGRPLRDSLVEMWQANAAGRYDHPSDVHDAPLDPNFRGVGQAYTDDRGCYRFLTIRPGCYPWRNTHNAWRPAHLHYSVYGRGFGSRLVTQMYFPGDPLLATDPIFHSIADPDARERLIAAYAPEISESEYALGYEFDIVVWGREQTPMETEHA